MTYAALCDSVRNGSGYWTEQQRTLLQLLETSTARMNHQEVLLLTFASVALGGWAFLFATPFRLSSAQRADPEFGKLMYAVLFSALVASAFNVIYLARMASSIRVLDLESFLCIPLKPFMDYQNYAAGHARASFYLTFLFMPILALGALAYVSYCVDWSQLFRGPYDARIRGIILSIALAASSIAIYSSSLKTRDSIEAFMRWKPTITKLREYTSQYPWSFPVITSSRPEHTPAK